MHDPNNVAGKPRREALPRPGAGQERDPAGLASPHPPQFRREGPVAVAIDGERDSDPIAGARQGQPRHRPALLDVRQQRRDLVDEVVAPLGQGCAVD